MDPHTASRPPAMSKMRLRWHKPPHCGYERQMIAEHGGGQADVNGMASPATALGLQLNLS